MTALPIPPDVRTYVLAVTLARGDGDVTFPAPWLRAALEVEPPVPMDLTCAQAGVLLNRAESTIRGWCQSGAIPGSYRMRGREWRIPTASLRAYQERQGGGAEPTGDLARWRRTAITETPPPGKGPGGGHHNHRSGSDDLPQR